MRRVLPLFVIISMAAASSAFAGAQAPAAASLAGTASNQTGQVLANTTVRLRNVTNGQLAGTTTSNSAGSFSFAGLNPGSYAVEVVNAAGEIIGTSASISVTAGAVVTGVAVTASAAAAATAGAVAAAAGGSFFASTAGIITVVAAGAAVAGVTVAATTASPSK